MSSTACITNKQTIKQWVPTAITIRNTGMQLINTAFRCYSNAGTHNATHTPVSLILCIYTISWQYHTRNERIRRSTQIFLEMSIKYVLYLYIIYIEWMQCRRKPHYALTASHTHVYTNWFTWRLDRQTDRQTDTYTYRHADSRQYQYRNMLAVIYSP